MHLYTTHMRAKPFLGLHSLQHVSPSCYSISKRSAACSLCSPCACQALSWPAHLIMCPISPLCASLGPYCSLSMPTNHAHVFPSHLCWVNLFMHPSCCCYGSMPYPSPLLVVATGHENAFMTPHLRAQGIMPLCQALSIVFELASLLLHHHASSKSILVLQWIMALCS